MARRKVALVCGGRDFKDYERLATVLSKLRVTVVVHGGAQGADSLAGEWARYRGFPEVVVPANWMFYGRSAGPKRNQWMLDLVPVDLVVAFPGGRGTADMVGRATGAGLKVEFITP